MCVVLRDTPLPDTRTCRYGVHPMIPSIIESMRTPSHFAPMAIASFCGVLGFYLPMVTVGYSIYGDGVASPIYETAALRQAPAVKVIIGFLSAHLLMAYPIVLNPPERALEAALGVEQSRCAGRCGEQPARRRVAHLDARGKEAPPATGSLPHLSHSSHLVVSDPANSPAARDAGDLNSSASPSGPALCCSRPE